MNKTLELLEKELEWFRVRKYEKIVEKFEARIKGKRGAPEKRNQFVDQVKKILSKEETSTYVPAHIREEQWRKRMALYLAEKSGQKFDEHGWERGDYMQTSGLDYVSPYHGSMEAPYCDMGGEGLGLIEITRKRVYSRTSGWSPSHNSTRYLVGRNESGTYFAHPVPKTINTVYDAVQWIWDGKADQIIARQGDIALIWGRGPKLPDLPRGHEVKGDRIIHESHPDLPLPKKGQRIIVGRRAAAQVSEATRD